MPDFLCIPADYLTNDENLKTSPIMDSQNRSWYCGQLPELTQEMQDSFSSPHAYAAWELTCLKTLLDQLRIPTPGMFDEWPPEISELYHLAKKIEAESSKSLTSALGSEEISAQNQPINLNPLRPIQLPQSTLSKDERKSLLKRARRVCKQHRESGSEKYLSGELQLNRYNYAKDIIRAADFALDLIESIPRESFCVETIQFVLERGEIDYLSEHEDMEGFAIGTIRCIQREISV
ncbi:hypothetical protein [Neptuniibacter halophilus]|uniref:hypothetical protein n=1 Tax=Neptuniibacter halophilus TaxID=651666 RepID=UPI0025744C96|nr:hypothetical protein [Neptuniibacter halophilus]